MKLSYDDHDAITVLTLSGPMTTDHADGFRRACEERFAAGVRDVILDVENVESVDSDGLECLLWLLDQATARGGRLRLVHLQRTLAHALHLTRLEGRFDVHATVESAGKSLRDAGMRESA